jgi:nucleoprotein TPR
MTAAENSWNALNRTYTEQSRRLGEAHASIANLTSAAAARKAASTNELTRLLDENRILERRAEEARNTIAEREAELERMSDAEDKKERAWQKKLEDETRARQDAEKRVSELRTVVNRLTTASGEGGELSSAAALASEQRAGGRSYIRSVMEFEIQAQQLQEAKEENKRLTNLLDDICSEIDEKVSIANAYRRSNTER